jgi:type III pantothenate kinase
MMLLLDVGNTHTHVGLGDSRRTHVLGDFATEGWRAGTAAISLRELLKSARPECGGFCSVVPAVNDSVRSILATEFGFQPLQLTSDTVRGVGIRYPKPGSIGQDRLANALAARHRFGAPVLVVDFGTAVTFDVVDRHGDYIGGIIAPGLSAMTDYLHEKTALLPRIRIREPRSVVGRSTEQAMLAGAVHGYRGLVRGLIQELRKELGTRRLRVVATGGYARLIARKMAEIDKVVPGLTLEGLRRFLVENKGGLKG